MQTMEIHPGVRVGYQEMVAGVSQMDTPALEKFMRAVGSILAGRKQAAAAAPADREAELLEKMGSLVPAFAKRRYRQLHAKLQKETISEAEHQELMQVIEFMEEKTVERIHLMAELAALRGISLQVLAGQLRMKNLADAET